MSTTTQLPVPFGIKYKQQQNSVARTWLSLLRLLIQAMITTRTIFPNHRAELWSAQNTTKCWQSNQCSTAKSMKQFRNINGTSGMLVSMLGRARQRCLSRHFLKFAIHVTERTDSGRLFHREGVEEWKALASALVYTRGADRVHINLHENYFN